MKISSYDAWVLARILTGGSIDGELAGMSDAYRSLARTLLEREGKDRKAFFCNYLRQRKDADALLGAIEAADPRSPAPPPVRANARLPVRLTSAADIRVRAVEWLWDGRVPLGMLSLWAGTRRWARATSRCRWRRASPAARRRRTGRSPRRRPASS